MKCQNTEIHFNLCVSHHAALFVGCQNKIHRTAYAIKTILFNNVSS